jgi:hypothetical protein
LDWLLAEDRVDGGAHQAAQEGTVPRRHPELSLYVRGADKRNKNMEGLNHRIANRRRLASGVRQHLKYGLAHHTAL